MKKAIVLIATVAATFGLFADEAYEFVTVNNGNGYGYSYIQINQNLDSFSFSPNWHSVAAAGKVGHVVYSSDMTEQSMKNLIEEKARNHSDAELASKKNNDEIRLGSLKAGDRIGFYEVRPNGGVYTLTAFKEWNGKTWLAFDKNKGNGKDEWMSIDGVSAVPASSTAPTGAPLPGVLATLLIGGLGIGGMKFRKRK